MVLNIYNRIRTLKSGLLLNLKRYSHKYPELNLDYLCNSQNLDIISQNITRRKGIGDISAVQQLYQQLSNLKSTDTDYELNKQQFYTEALKIPNVSHPDIIKYGDEPQVVKYCGNKREFDVKPKEFHEITKQLNLMRTLHLGNVAGNRSYYFLGELAELEQALIKYTVQKLLKLNFKMISVPDILRSDIIESCGMNTKGERTQIYKLDPQLHGDDYCLSGTSEMGIAGYLRDKIFEFDELPHKLMAVSRCYRAETSSVAEERGIYRVHQFTKVEMFSVTTENESEQTLEKFREIQEELFTSLGLHFQVLDMPCHELGAPAHRKYDIEAWMPGRDIYGEISSCSNCTDYQSRRLNVKYVRDGELRFVHTLNGTACAVPRMLIAILESYQDGESVRIPEVLRPFMRHKTLICKQKKIPELKLKKMKR